MASIITNSFRILQAKQFRQAFEPTADSTVYIGISKPTPWDNELLPEIPVDSSSFNVSDFREWMAAKRLSIADTTLAIPRINWTSGTVYDAYDDGDTDLLSKQFYVLTDELNLYKCISKPASGTQSTSKPTSTSTSGFVTTGDGYVWKYLMSISAPTAAKFLTDLWVPVKDITEDDFSGSNQWQVQQNATPGTIDRIVLTNGGSGYISPTVQIEGDGVGATATATVAGGVITGITVTNRGSGYTYANVIITGAGTNATARAVISPMQGHGANVVSELGGYYIIINAVLNYDESGKFPRFNDYRKIFLIQNPALFGTSTLATDAVYSCVNKVTVTTTTGDFVPDETITGSTSGSTGVVVEYDSVTKTVSYVLKDGDFVLTENIIGSVSGTIGNYVSALINPELDTQRGSIVYKDYRRYIDRQPDQTENIVIVIQF